eukprot:215653-Chlamydomonas_euryale.AAC.1
MDGCKCGCDASVGVMCQGVPCSQALPRQISCGTIVPPSRYHMSSAVAQSCHLLHIIWVRTRCAWLCMVCMHAPCMQEGVHAAMHECAHLSPRSSRARATDAAAAKARPHSKRPRVGRGRYGPWPSSRRRRRRWQPKRRRRRRLQRVVAPAAAAAACRNLAPTHSRTAAAGAAAAAARRAGSHARGHSGARPWLHLPPQPAPHSKLADCDRPRARSSA